MTAPLTPPDCDLRDYPWMPLDCTRLLTSETWIMGTADEKVAALTLWCKSWHQVPAGSLPNNDRMLDVLSEAAGKWVKVRDHALRGWILCSDGRLYHPVVAEKANYSWALKLKQKARTQAARDALDAKRRTVTGTPQASVTATVTAPVAETVTGSIRTEQNRTEQNSLEGESAPRSAAPPPRAQNGCRLPVGWLPDDPFCEGATHATLVKFRDYWIAQPGAKGRKADWQATWRNWCRRDAEQQRTVRNVKSSQWTVDQQNDELQRLMGEAVRTKEENPVLRLAL